MICDLCELEQDRVFHARNELGEVLRDLMAGAESTKDIARFTTFLVDAGADAATVKLVVAKLGKQ